MASAFISSTYRRRVAEALQSLGISEAEHLAARKLALMAEAVRLMPVGLGTDGRDKMLAPRAARAWTLMRTRAAADGVELLLVSGFRSVDFQIALIRNKLQRGMKIEEILRVNAPPGYSEHHSGRAVDIGASGVEPLEEVFDQTAAFAWLRENAEAFGFTMSYPRGNPQGFLYEPWHWCHQTSR